MKGPRPLSKPPLGGIPLEAGAWTEIVSLSAPSTAVAGAQVPIVVKVKNIFSLPIYIAVTGRYDGVDIAFSPSSANIGAGATYSFTSSFIMPNKSVKLDVWSFYWVDYVGWYQDDQKSVSISMQAVWVKLSQSTLALTIAPVIVPVWVKLSQSTLALTIAPVIVPVWVKLSQSTLAVAIQSVIVPVWVKLSQTTLALTVSTIVTGWVKLMESTLALTLGPSAGLFKNLKVIFKK